MFSSCLFCCCGIAKNKRDTNNLKEYDPQQNRDNQDMKLSQHCLTNRSTFSTNFDQENHHNHEINYYKSGRENIRRPQNNRSQRHASHYKNQHVNSHPYNHDNKQNVHYAGLKPRTKNGFTESRRSRKYNEDLVLEEKHFEEVNRRQRNIRQATVVRCKKLLDDEQYFSCNESIKN